MVEFDVHVQAVPEAQVHGQVGDPQLLPLQVFVARLRGGDAGVAVVVQAAAHERHMFVVGDRRVTRGTRAEGDLRVGEPAARVLHEFLVAQVPHHAHRAERRPASRGAEARGAVGTDGEVDVVTVGVVVFAAREERQEGVVVVGDVAPRRGTCSRRDVDQLVVVLAAGRQRELLVAVIDALLAQQEVERVPAVEREAVVDRVGDRKAHAVGRVALCRARAQVGRVVGVGGAEARRVRIVHAELRPDGEPLDGGGLGEERRDHLVFLIGDLVVGQPFERVLALALPGAVLDRGQRAVGTVGIPVRHHETCGRDGGHERILARFGAFDGLVVHHRVGAELEPFGGLLLDVGAERETLEGRTYGDALLVVVAARDVVIGLVGGPRNRELVVLEQGGIVEHLVEPVDVGLAQDVVVFAVGEPDLLLVPDAFVGVHQIPVAVGDLRETELHAVVDLRPLGHAPAFGRDDDHAVGRARTIYRGGGGVLEHRDALDVGRVDGVEVGTGDGDPVEDVERRGTRVDRVHAPDHHRCRRARLTRIGKYRQAGNLSLDGLVERRRRGVLDLFGLDGRYRSGNGALLADTVSDDHHVVERLCLALEGDVVGQRGAAARNREGGGLVADVLEGERRPCGDADRVASVRKGAHPAGGPGNHVDPDEGLLVIRRGDDASDGHISPPLRYGYRRQGT